MKSHHRFSRRLLAGLILLGLLAAPGIASAGVAAFLAVDNGGIWEISVLCDDGLTGEGSFFGSLEDAAAAAESYCENNSL